MEILNPDQPSFINDVYFTDTGEKTGRVLPGEWRNFNESLNMIGVRILALDGTEHIQISGSGRARVSFSFANISQNVADRIVEVSSNSEVTVGLARRYPIIGGPGDGKVYKNVIWVFHSVSNIILPYGMLGGRLDASFSGRLYDVLDCSIAAPEQD